MRVSVTDGLNTARPNKFVFRILDLNLHLVKNEALDVFPMMTSTITPNQLLVIPSDWRPTREISYIVKRMPTQGRLMYRDVNSQRILELKNFTQSQVQYYIVRYLNIL